MGTEHEDQPPAAMRRGVSARSRAEILLHRTRSGLSRTDPGDGHRCSTISPRSEYSANGRCAIKDLRLRRVFSPISIVAESSSDQKHDGRSCEERMDAVDELVVGKTRDGVGIERGLPGSVCGPRVEMEEKCTGEEKMRDLCGEHAASVTTEDTLPSKSRTGIKPCARVKLFRNSSSFSYRRLLPFFMDLVKDSSNDLQILSCDNSQHKVKKSLEDKSTWFDSSNLLGRQFLPRGCTEEESRGGLKADVSEIEESSSKVAECITSGSPTKYSKVEVHGDTTSKNEFYNAREVDLIEIKSEISDGDLDQLGVCKSSHSASTVPEALLVGESAGNVQDISCLPIIAERSDSFMVNELEIEKRIVGYSELLSVYSMERCSSSPRKGILKRETSGCRGICMCLDCVSFRIHADRAFEFSRKQMLEADEIIESLTKELAGVRSLVEKSILSMPEGGGSHIPFQVNQELLKGACYRSSRAEEVSKKRRRQMFDELNMHCRNPGSRVTFAEPIDESHNCELEESVRSSNICNKISYFTDSFKNTYQQ